MALRKDTNGMTERELLSEIYNKVEILDDIVRGDPDRGTVGLQDKISELQKDVAAFKQGKLVRQTLVTSTASIITVLASLATVITIAWQATGG